MGGLAHCSAAEIQFKFTGRASTAKGHKEVTRVDHFTPHVFGTPGSGVLVTVTVVPDNPRNV